MLNTHMHCMVTSRKNIVFIGLPGCGKGTQAKRIAERFDLKHITTGQLLRSEAKKDTEMAKLIDKLSNTGELFPDELVNKVLLKNMPTDNYILDGYPRKLSQVDTIKDIDLVINIKISEEEAVRRVLNRKEGRNDDNPEAIKLRIQLFNEETKDVMEFYKNKGLLVDVDGEKSVDDVFADIEKIICDKFY